MSTATPESKSPEVKVDIEDVQAVEFLRITFNPLGGIQLITGDQGVGKSTALDAVRRWAGNDKIKLEPRDKKKRGSIRSDNVTISIGSRTTATGECEVHSVEGEIDITAFIAGDGIQSPERADAARIKKLLRMRKVTASPATFERLLGSVEALEKYVDDPEILKMTDLVDMAAAIKRKLDAAALAQERLGDTQASHGKAHEDVVAAVDVTLPDDELSLRADHEKAIGERGRITQERVAAGKRSQEVSQAREALESAKRCYDGPSSLVAEVDQYGAAQTVEKAENEVAEVERLLAEAKSRLQDAQRALASASHLHKLAVQHETLCAGWEQSIAAGAVVAPSADEMAAAELAVNQSADAVEMGVKVRSAKRSAQIAADHRKQAAEHVKLAAQLRNAGKMTDDILSDAVQGGVLRVSAGRLVLDTHRGEEYLSELSEGERADIAIDLGIEIAGLWGLVTVDQGVMGELSPGTRRRIHGKSQAKQVHVLSIVASDGPLRMAEFDPVTAGPKVADKDVEAMQRLVDSANGSEGGVA